MTDGQFLWVCVLAVTGVVMAGDMAVRAVRRHRAGRQPTEPFDWAARCPELRQPSHVRRIA